MRTVKEGEYEPPFPWLFYEGGKAIQERMERDRLIRQAYIGLLEAFVLENKAPGVGEQQLTSFRFQARDLADAQIEKEEEAK